MDLDLIFVIALLVGVFALPLIVSALSDKRWPVNGVVMLVIAGVAIAYTVQEDASRYTVENADTIVVEVLGRYIN
ncbi:hypothetical protein [Yoonia litorea]|uniref:Uncharacterized protein n=1 Tax=Yoonia litorea TaxID=1123755 RepID=A0A1I6N1T7_9RHOB|nr:hypothetical protein [Yoonia litorea]SFS21874.1 hypothetical protein SAMN05444714_2990 [Yoonia litorea]